MEGNDMSIFSGIEDLELNFEGLDLGKEEPIEEFEQDIEEDSVDMETPEDINEPGEEQEVPEEVTGEEGQDEGNEPSEEDDDSSPEEVDSSGLYSSLASLLTEEGVLPSLDLEKTQVKSVEDLTSTIKQEIAAQVKNSLIDKIGEDGYNALEKGVTLQEYQSYEQSLDILDNITEDRLREDIELAQQIILQDYIEQGIERGRALRILKRSMDSGEEFVIEDAIESLNSLKQVQNVKLEALAQEREAERIRALEAQKQIDNDLKNSIYSSKEFIKGLKVNKAIKDRVYKSMTQTVSVSPDGIAENKLLKHRREDPINFDVKLYYLYELTNGFEDFSKLVNKSESKAAQRLEEAIKKTKFNTSSNPGFMDDPQSYGGWGENTELVM